MEAQGRISAKLTKHTDLIVYQRAFRAAMVVFEMTKYFPYEERYALTNQIRRSSRSVCANLAEGWRKRRYRAAFISKLSDFESEAGETQAWLEFSVSCGYAKNEETRELYREYNQILAMLVSMIKSPDSWIL